MSQIGFIRNQTLKESSLLSHCYLCPLLPHSYPAPAISFISHAHLIYCPPSTRTGISWVRLVTLADPPHLCRLPPRQNDADTNTHAVITIASYRAACAHPPRLHLPIIRHRRWRGQDRRDLGRANEVRRGQVSRRHLRSPDRGTRRCCGCG